MKLLDRYIVRSILGAIMAVLLVLLGLRTFIEFVGQLNDVEGDYTLLKAAAFVALRTPRAIFEMLPAAALLGALLGLGSLATHSELVVMRASGVSRVRLMASAGLAGVVLMVVMALLGESIAPSAGQYARQLRAAAKHQDLTMATGTDVWLKQGPVIVNLRQLNEDVAGTRKQFDLPLTLAKVENRRCKGNADFRVGPRSRCCAAGRLSRPERRPTC